MCVVNCRLARSARCTSSATSNTGRPAAAHSTSRSAASKIRNRSSSGAATGGEAAIRQVAIDAGFTRFRRAAETPFNLVFEARP